MYYDDEGSSSYYKWYKQAKEFEKMRKAKKKKAEIRKKKLAKEKARLLVKQQKLEQKQREIEARQEQKRQTLEELKSVGYKPSWTKQNPLKRAKNSRDLKLCQEIYEKAKAGISTFSLAKEYNMHPNTILRHKYEYEYYLGIKGIDKKVKV